MVNYRYPNAASWLIIIGAPALSYVWIVLINPITRLQIDPYIYSASFTALMISAHGLADKIYSRSSICRAAFLGAVIGYLCGMASFFTEYSLRKFGFERLNSTLSNLDVLSFLLGFAAPPLFTGGWIVGCTLFILRHKIQKSGPASNKHE